MSWVKLPIDDFSMCTAPAFWMSMPILGNGPTAPGTPRDVEAAQRDDVVGAGIDHDAGGGWARWARAAEHADARRRRRTGR